MQTYRLDPDTLDKLQACLKAVDTATPVQSADGLLRPSGKVAVVLAPEPTERNAAWLVMWTESSPGMPGKLSGQALAMTADGGITVGRFPPVARGMNGIRTRGDAGEAAQWRRVRGGWANRQRVEECGTPPQQHWCGATTCKDGETLQDWFSEHPHPLVVLLRSTFYTAYTEKLRREHQ